VILAGMRGPLWTRLEGTTMVIVHWIENDICAGDDERVKEFTNEEEALRFEAFLDVESSEHWRDEGEASEDDMGNQFDELAQAPADYRAPSRSAPDWLASHWAKGGTNGR
jgi:hypothetical protein